jgi:hypothetical protein
MNCLIPDFIEIRSSFLNLFTYGRTDRNVNLNTSLFLLSVEDTRNQISFGKSFVLIGSFSFFSSIYRSIYSLAVQWQSLTVDIDNSSDLYSGSARIESRLGHLLLYLGFFVVSLSSGIISRLGHDRFFQDHFQFIIHWSSYQPRLCSPHTNSVAKQTDFLNCIVV